MQECVQDSETCMKALLFDPRRFSDLDSVMDKIERSLPEGQVADLANINRFK